MSKRSPDFIVIDPYLTPIAFAARITPAKLAFIKDQYLPDSYSYSQFLVVPYTKKLHRHLKAQYAAFYSQHNYVPSLSPQ
jgi:hypothetical protein